VRGWIIGVVAAILLAALAATWGLWNDVEALLGGVARLEHKMDRPQTVTIRPCPPDERIVVVVRAPGQMGTDWAQMAYRYATDRTWRGNAAILDKTTLWVWEETTVEVVTPRGRDESDDEWCKRHDLAVADQQAIFPCV